MTRWAFKLEYEGTDFVGWQRQINGPSVQSVLEAALARLEGQPVATIVAGRTDSGVHAAGQVAHADLARPDLPGREMAPGAVLAAINYHLKPHPVAVLAAAIVGDAFSARFSAIGRRYVYRIVNRPARAALLARRAWHVAPWLDVAAMQEGADLLLGRHDFTSFRARACQAASPLRTLDRLVVRRDGEMVEIEASARSFLHHQVRNMVGSLKLVGEGRWAAAAMGRVLAACDRGAAGPTAPPDGLYLTEVRYPVDPFGADRSEPEEMGARP